MSKEITASIRINAIIDKATRDLQTFRGQLNQIWQGSEPPKGILKSFEGLRLKLASLQELSKKGVVDKTALAQVESEYTAFQKIIHNLTVEFKTYTTEQKKGMMSKDEVAGIQARAAAFKAYTDEIKKNQEALTKQQELQSQRSEAVSRKQQLTANKTGLTERKEKLEKTGPQLTPEAQAYAVALEKQKKLLTEIGQLESRLGRTKNADKRASTESEIAALQQQLQALDTSTGKASYDQAWQNYNTTLQQIRTSLVDTDNQIRSTDREIATLDKTLAGLSVGNEAQAFNRLKEALKSAGVEGADTATDFKTLQEMAKRLDAEGIKRVEASLRTGTQQLDRMGKGALQMKTEIDKANGSLKEQDRIMSEQNAIVTRIKNFLGLTGAMNTMRRIARDAINTIKELDATMTEMSVVTNMDIGGYWEQLPQYTKRANELGLAINDVYKADTLYYQQGLKTQQVVELSTETMKMAKIAGLDTAEATDRMTAALRGFNMELTQTNAQNVADVYAKLAAITASDVNEISAAMTKTASIASSAGMEFETTAAFLSQIIETTRESAETAGTAMKTVIARFQELKKDPAEIGEVDGEIVDANKIETALRSVGVALRDEAGQFRELDDVFLELSKKWNTLDKNTQRYIATIAAGSRQQSRFIAMMSNYERTQELVSEANNSAGTSNQQFEKTLESLATKLNQLKNAWHEFTMGIFESDIVKTGVDILTKFLEIINKASSGLKGWAGSITKIIGLVAIFKTARTLFKNLQAPISNMFKQIVATSYSSGKKATEEFARGSKEAGKTAQAQNQGQTTGELPEGYKRDKNGRLRYKGKFVSSEEEQRILATNQNSTQNGQAVQRANLFTRITGGNFGALGQKLSNNKAIKVQEARIQETKQKIASAEQGSEAQKSAQADLERQNKELDSLKAKQAELGKDGKTVWGNLASGIGHTAAAVSSLGMGLSMLGGLFAALGLEEAGETIATVGNVMMVLGTTIAIVCPIINVLGITFQKAGKDISVAGWIAQGGWIWLVSIVAAIVLLVVGISHISKALKEADPKEKLNKAIEAQNEAADAAKRTAESYENLKNSLEALDGQYDALDKLTRGTKEWNSAVQDINNSVLNLIDDYPELAKFVENKEGVLTIDMESDAIQEVIQQKQGEAVISKNNEILANAAVQEAQLGVQFGEMEAIDKIATQRGWNMFGKSAGMGAAIGGGIGAVGGGVLGGILGSLGGPGGTVAGAAIGAGVTGIAGAAVGSVVGAITGAIVGPIEASKTKTDKALQEAVGELAKSVSEGAVGTDYNSMYTYLTETMGVVASEAAILAEEFSNDVGALADYGAAIAANEAQQQAAYDAIAASAQQLANTMTFTSGQITQSSVMIDGDFIKEAYEAEMDNLNTQDFENIKNLDDATKKDLDEAIRQQYGEGATIDESGKVTYQVEGEDGKKENKEVTLSPEQMKTMIANKKATEAAADAIEASADAIDSLAKTMEKDLGKTGDSIQALYSANEGGALTQENMNELKELFDSGEEEDKFSAEEWFKLTDDEKKENKDNLSSEIKALWESLDEKQRKAYHNDITKLADDLAEGVVLGERAFEKAGEYAKDYMTSLMAKGYSEKLEQTGYLAGGEEAKSAIDEETEALLEGKNRKVQQQIQSAILAADWTSVESLDRLEQQLIKTYGLSAEKVQAYIQLLKENNYAISQNALAIEKLNEVWQSAQKIAQSQIRLSEAQWQYNRAIEQGADNLSEFYKEILGEFDIQRQEYSTSASGIQEHIINKFGEAFNKNGINWAEYITFNEQGIDYDKSDIEGLKTIVGDDTAVESYLKEIEELYKEQLDNYEKLKKTLEDIEELEKQGEQAYTTLRDLVKDALLNSLQEQIDLEQATLDATQDANDRILSKMQEQLDTSRQQRDNERTKQGIADLEAKRAYLAASGGSALELAELDKQIAESRESYQDSLVDQALQNIQDANERAAEQRQEQIDIASAQLDLYKNSEAFQRDIDTNLQTLLNNSSNWTATEIGIKMIEQLESMSDDEKKKWQSETSSLISQTKLWQDTDWTAAKENVTNDMEVIQGLISALPTRIYSVSQDKYLENARTSLEGKGFNREELNGLNADQIATLENFVGREGSAENINNMTRDAKKYGVEGIKSQQQYYQEILEQVRKDENYDINTADSYEEYLSGVLENSSKYKVGQKSELADFKPTEVGSSGIRKMKEAVDDEWWFGDAYINGKNVGQVAVPHHLNTNYELYHSPEIDAALTAKTGGTPEQGWVAMYGGEPYAYNGWGWARITNGHSRDKLNKGYENIKKKMLEYLAEYKTGGLADFTGPAWLDGTKARPELVLNQTDTQNFIALKDILADVMKNNVGSSKSNSSGNNYFDIEINVESLENDYDVEQIADKIRDMIYRDATYRNVNTVNQKK